MEKAGEIIIFINAHGYVQVLSYSPNLSEVLIVDRIKRVENTDIRMKACHCIVELLKSLAIDLQQITIVMDLYCRVAFITYNDEVTPIYSTANKQLGRTLLALFEALSVTDKKTFKRICSPQGFEIIQKRLRMYTVKQYDSWWAEKAYESHKNKRHCENLGIKLSGHFDQVFSDDDLYNVSCQMDLGGATWQDLKPLLQRSFECASFLLSIQHDFLGGISYYGKKLIQLIGTRSDEQAINSHPNLVAGCDIRSPDILRTVEHLVVKAEECLHTGEAFSVNRYNMILSYIVARKVQLNKPTLVHGCNISRDIKLAEFESVMFPADIRVLPVLKPTDEKAIKLVGSFFD